MKMGLISNNSKHSGLGRYAFELYNMLKSDNIDLVFLNYDKRFVEKIKEGENEIIAKTINFPLIDNKIFFWHRMKKMIPEYDLYHLTNQNISFIKKKNAIVTCNDIMPYIHPSNVFEFYVRKYLYSGLKRASRVISISEQTKVDLITYFNIDEDNITVVPLGVNHGIFNKIDGEIKSNKNPKHLTILHVGTEQKNKNVDSLIKAFYKLHKKNLDIKLVRVGTKSKFIDKIIKKYHLEKSIEYKTNVSERELVRLYNIADLFVFPSLYEGFGLPPLEAMACGTPVITSNTSSLPEVVGDAGILLDPYDIDGWVNAMYEVLTNDGLREDMIKRGLERATMFSWEKCAKETSKVYEEVLER